MIWRESYSKRYFPHRSHTRLPTKDGLGPVAIVEYFFTRWLQVNKILLDHNENSYHSHPASFISIIISGGYREERLCRDGSTQLFTRRWFNYVPFHVLHRVDQVKPGTWTIIIFNPFGHKGGLWRLEYGKRFWVSTQRKVKT
jgi:hypothetical protein